MSSRTGDAAEDNDFFKAHPIYSNDILEGLQTLYQQYVLSEDATKLARIRVENLNAFHAFVILCLRHTLGVMSWKLKHRRMLLSDVFSISDEALALVIFENNALVWRNKAYGQPDVTARYMQTAKDGNIRKVWSDEGMKRFNELFGHVKQFRLVPMSKTNETELMKMWNNKKSKNGGSGSTNGSVEGRSRDEEEVNARRREIIVICEG